MDLNDLNGKTLTLLVIGEDENGEDDWAVFRGTARWDGTDLHFVRNGVDFAVPADAIERIRPVPVDSEVRSILLNAEYYIPLSIGPLPDNADESEFIKTGLKWQTK